MTTGIEPTTLFRCHIAVYIQKKCIQIRCMKHSLVVFLEPFINIDSRKKRKVVFS